MPHCPTSEKYVDGELKPEVEVSACIHDSNVITTCFIDPIARLNWCLRTPSDVSVSVKSNMATRSYDSSVKRRHMERQQMYIIKIIIIIIIITGYVSEITYN